MADAPMDMSFGYGRELSEECPTKICEVGGQGFLALPWGGDDEQEWHPVLRTVLYLIALVWFFLGVALIADVFMGAIEHITSQKKREWSADKKRHVTTLVWNPTVANLTLMALGSSAPEILLSVIELLGNGIYAGDLGPSTIVGSAAFNLFVIIAVCIMAIPDGDLRRIKEMPVYFVTAVWSLFAYLWLLVILQGISPNVVEIWEGLFTFLFFPLLVIMAFVADKGYFPGSEEKEEEDDPLADVSRHMSKEELAQVEAKVRRSYGELSESQIAKIISVEHNPNSRAHHRVAAIRALTGGKRVRVTRSTRSSVVESVKARLSTRMSRRSSRVAPSEASVVGKTSDESTLSKPSSDLVSLEFGALQFAVVENAGKREVPVVRKGNLEGVVRVRYCTREGTAKAGEDYEHSEGVLEFAPGVREVKLSVKIVDDTAFENDEEFFIDLSEPSSDKEGVTVQVGELSTATVVIIDDDLPGQISFAFPEDSITVQESGGDRTVDLTVQRKHGCTGNVTCKYYTEDGTAKAGLDYEPLEGVLTFDEGQTALTLKCTIKGSGRYDRKEMFRVMLEAPTGGATFDPKTDGGADSCVLTVFVEGEGPVAKARVDRIMRTLTRKWEKSSIGHSNWKDQFLDALYVNGKPDDPQENEELLECPHSPGSAGGSIGMNSAASMNSNEMGEPSCQDYAMHIITLPWKVLFAFVPPTDYCGGWCCFCCSLGMIALVTALIGDMAALLGCVMGIPDEITAITFVALGTSLPDTFASKTAAIQDPSADASIGNVTGSNSVNVFLGLGLPWTIGSLYWTLGGADAKWKRKFGMDMDIEARFRDGSFVVKAGTLGFSVATFSCCAMVAMIMLYVRRKTVGGELGGPRMNKIVSASFLVMLWVIYVVLSSWYALKERTCP